MTKNTAFIRTKKPDIILQLKLIQTIKCGKTWKLHLTQQRTIGILN